MNAAPVTELRTRRPTGKPPWPMILLAGVEKSGKSWAAAELSASDLVDRTLWVEIGEGAVDQYGALPGARYEIALHDGTYRGIGNAIWAATRQPRPNGKPHAIVLDSVTNLWDMLADEAQGIANERARRAAAQKNRPAPTGDRTITVDLWNNAKKRWGRIIDMLRTYDGPVILTSRLELVTVMNGSEPTTEKTWKVRAEKNLPYEVDAVVRFTAPRSAELTGVRSVRLCLDPGECRPLPGFTLDGLLRSLGLAEQDATSSRVYVAPVPDWAEAERDAQQPPGEAPARPQSVPAAQQPSAAPSLFGSLAEKIRLAEGDDALIALHATLVEHQDANRLTAPQFKALVGLLDARYRAMHPEAPEQVAQVAA